MSGNFNYFSLPESPTLILCNPDDTEIGVISNYSELQTDICLTDISSISYKIYWSYSDEENINEVYEKHMERREVYVDNLGYFIISDVSEFEDEDGRYKKIQAQSCESELNNINMPYVDGTYILYKAENFPDQKMPSEIVSQGDDYQNENCILYEIMKSIPSWTLDGQMELLGDNTASCNHDYSDLANTFRTFESTDTTIYSFLRNELSDSYECFVKFDIKNRKIRIVKHEDVFNELPVVISNENFLNKCEVKTTIDNYVNCLNVDGTTSVSIGSHNPMGGSTIYNFDHDINTGLIDGELKDALEYWKEHVSTSGKFDGVSFNRIETNILGGHEILYGQNCVQDWLDGISQISKYKTDLLEAIGSGEQSEIDTLIGWDAEHQSVDSNTQYLLGIGLDYVFSFVDKNGQTAVFDGRQKRIEYITQIANLTRLDDDKDIDTGSISNLFYDMQFDLSNLLYIYTPNMDGTHTRHSIFTTCSDELRYLSETARNLISAQELKIRIASELKNMTSTYNGFEAEYEALQSTQTESKYNIFLNEETGLWECEEKSDDNADILEVETLVDQLNIVKNYLTLAEREISAYENILGSDDDDMSQITVNGLVKCLSNFITTLQNQNGFRNRFAEKYINNVSDGRDVTELDRENAKNWSEKLYTNLTRYLKQQTYTDENIIITDSMSFDEKFQQEEDLYNKSVSMLAKISEPSYEVVVGAEAFVFIPELIEEIRSIYGHENVSDVLDIYNSVHIKLPDGDIPIFHFLKISTNYDEMTCDLTLGNRIRISDPASVFSDLQKTASSAANVIASERLSWGINEEKINALMSERLSNINTTQRAMTNSLNDVTFGDFGLKCFARDRNNNPSYGIWCANGVMMFMDENGSSKMAIGRIINSDGSVGYGFNGQSIVANTVTVDKLVAGALSKGTNYIRNGSFESETDYWDIPDGAILEEAYRKDLAYPTGYKCIYIKSGNTISQTLSSISSTAGENSYVLSFYYRRNTDEEDKAFDKIENLKISIINRDTDEEIGSCWHTDNQLQYNAVNNSTTSAWNRCYKLIHLPSVANIRVEIQNGSAYGICIDGVMLEKAVDLNDYTPHINETYAKYTTINDSGVTVYDGKIRILNNSGVEVFGADEGGNLTLTGNIRASGGDIAGWLIQPESLTYGKDQNGNPTYVCGISTKEDDPAFWSGYTGTGVVANEENTNFFVTRDGAVHAKSGKIGGWTIDSSKLYNGNGHTGMSTTGAYVFYAGDSSNYNFSVTQKGALFARNAEIDKKLTLKNGSYTMEFDGYTILMKYGNSDKFSSAISFTSTADGFFGSATNNANLAIAGSTKILFGTRPGGDWKGLCEIEHSISGSAFDAFYLKPCTGVLDRAMLGSAAQPWTDVWVEGSFGIPIQLSAIIQAISDTLVALPVVGARALYVAALTAHGITGLIT